MRASLPFERPCRKFQVRDQVKKAFGQSCAYCGRSVSLLTLDHLVPVSKGGTDRRRNLVPACSRCNEAKGSLSLEEWYTPDLKFYAVARLQQILKWSGKEYGASPPPEKQG